MSPKVADSLRQQKDITPGNSVPQKPVAPAAGGHTGSSQRVPSEPRLAPHRLPGAGPGTMLGPVSPRMGQPFKDPRGTAGSMGKWPASSHQAHTGRESESPGEGRGLQKVRLGSWDQQPGELAGSNARSLGSSVDVWMDVMNDRFLSIQSRKRRQ